MSFSKVTLISVLSLVVLFSLTRADGGYSSQENEPMPYEFEYAVKDEYSGNDFGHSEKSEDGKVTGEYYVQLPDGRLQKVSYTADHDNGYQADVTYEGEASYDQPQTKYDD